MDAHDYRNALGPYPAGVNIVTALDSANEPWRLRANSFTSVYLNPPVVPVCIAKLGQLFWALPTSYHFPEPLLLLRRRRFFPAPQTEAEA